MKNVIAAALGLILSSAVANAQPAFDFLGDHFVRKHEKISERAGLIEFVPADETLQSWTKLVGFRAFLDSGQSANEAAKIVVGLARQRYPGAAVRVLSKGSEAIAEFVISTPSGLVEFNAFKYGPARGGRGLVSVQYARRFQGLEPADVRRLGGPWTEAIAGFDLEAVRSALSRKNKLRSV
jgi:hypothetical protein